MSGTATRAPESVSRNFDVAIVGSGYAGLAAAIEASKTVPHGKILIIEKMSEPGGNSVMNAGQIAAVGSKQQKFAGIEDSVELMMGDMRKSIVGNVWKNQQIKCMEILDTYV
jgi:succinate dehydrogenase/fumarate reductase flavoprotein subunit